jgi:hypothetical protein
MMSSKKKIYSIPKSKIEFENVNTIIADNIINYDIENKDLLNLIKFNKKPTVISLNRHKSHGKTI